MKSIKSFSEARRKLAEMRDSIGEIGSFLDFADEAISKVNTLKGSDSQPELGIGLPQSKPPATWAERVIEIFKRTGNKPLMQKDAVNAYSHMGWPVPSDSAGLYRAISGAMAYLCNKKGILVKAEQGYMLKE